LRHHHLQAARQRVPGHAVPVAPEPARHPQPDRLRREHLGLRPRQHGRRLFERLSRVDRRGMHVRPLRADPQGQSLRPASQVCRRDASRRGRGASRSARGPAFRAGRGITHPLDRSSQRRSWESSMREELVIALSLFMIEPAAADWRNDRLKEIQAALDANEASRAQYCTVHTDISIRTACSAGYDMIAARLRTHESELRFMIAVDEIPSNLFLKTLLFDPSRSLGVLQKEMANTKTWSSGIDAFFRDVRPQ